MRRKATRTISRRKSRKRPFRWLVVLMVLALGLGMVTASRQKAARPVEKLAQAMEETVPKPVKDVAEQAPVLPPPVAKPAEAPKEAVKPVPKASAPAAQPEQTAGTVLPGIEKGQYSGRLAIVIDDCGYALDPVRTLVGLPVPMSFAIIPFKPNSSEALQIIRAGGRTAMLHLPMEPEEGGSSESRSVNVGMTAEQIQNLVQDAIDSLPGIAGVNNHQGSKATAHGPTILAALRVIGKNGLFFIDSRTNAATVAEKKAAQLGIPTGHNSLFLDNSSNVGDIRKQIARAIKLADRYGSLIVICHARPDTAEAWKESVQAVKESGITLVPVESLLK